MSSTLNFLYTFSTLLTFSILPMFYKTYGTLFYSFYICSGLHFTTMYKAKVKVTKLRSILSRISSTSFRGFVGKCSLQYFDILRFRKCETERKTSLKHIWTISWSCFLLISWKTAKRLSGEFFAISWRCKCSYIQYKRGHWNKLSFILTFSIEGFKLYSNAFQST